MNKKVIKCFKCGKEGHIVVICKSKSNESAIKCYGCGRSLHISRSCPDKMQVIECSKTHLNISSGDKAKFFQKSEAQYSAEDQIGTEEPFIFFSCCCAKETEEVRTSLVIDSGFTNYMIKDKSLFVELDESFGGKISNANESELLIKGKRKAEVFVRDIEVKKRQVFLSETLFLPQNS